MAHMQTLAKCGFFFPIGNTPPMCLTGTLAPEIDADILLLGCGDPRHILFTVHSGLDHASRKLDFTCCDLEPAVLARNILLLTLIADDSPYLVNWRIFYHFFLDDEALQHLFTQCKALFDLSNDLASWNTSKYAKFIRFCSEQSLFEVRQMWGLYFQTQRMSAKALKALKKAFTSRMQAVKTENMGSGGDAPTGRSANIFALDKEITKAGDRAFKTYWSTGGIPIKGHTLASPHLNPLFAYTRTGRGFNMHPMLHPIAAYHLGHVVTRAKANIEIEHLVSAAMEQFSTWSSSLRSKIHASKTIVIRFFSGDALALCHALQKVRVVGSSRTSTGIPHHSSTTIEIRLTEDYEESAATHAPSTFNVVDTSNLADSLGLFNIVVATAPLLTRYPWSVLHTNMLGQLSPGKSLSETLSNRVLSDISTFSFLVGIFPSSHLFHVASATDGHDEMITMASSNGGILGSEYHQLVTWRFASSITPQSTRSQNQLDQHPALLSLDDPFMARFLRLLYERMFPETCPSRPTTKDQLCEIHRWELGHFHYTRATFIEFLRLIRPRVQVNWANVMELFFAQAPSTVAPFEQEFEELACGLHIHGFYTRKQFLPQFLEDQGRQNNLFRGWNVIPPVVTITMKVPREALTNIETLDPMRTSLPPGFMCYIDGVPGCFEFSSLRLAFGGLMSKGDLEDESIHIAEDPAGWRGKSSAIFSFDAPSWTLTGPAQSTTVVLWYRPLLLDGINQKSHLLSRILLVRRASDQQNVHITRCSPIPSPIMKPTGRFVSVSVDSSDKVSSMTIREDIHDPLAAKSLLGGAIVSSHVVSDTAISVSFKDFKKVFLYPAPVLSDHTKIRIARRSSYLEVVALFRSDFEETVINKPSLNPFPIAHTQHSHNPIVSHYVNLQTLPVVAVPLPSRAKEKFSLNLGMMRSEEETKFLHLDWPWRNRPLIFGMKQQINDLFKLWTGIPIGAQQPKHPQDVLCLVADDVGLFAVLFVNDIRLDQPAQTVVMDAAVVPVTRRNVQFVETELTAVLGRLATVVQSNEAEFKTWRSLLPMFVERCRTWVHTSQCELNKKGVPIGGKDEVAVNLVNPLCSCGSGLDLGAFADQGQWETLRPFATRAAISPFFSYSLHQYFTQICVEKAQTGLPQPGAVGGNVPPNVYSKKACAQCSTSGSKLKECVGCNQPRYCSRNCQKLHWKGVHRAQCVAFN